MSLNLGSVRAGERPADSPERRVPDHRCRYDAHSREVGGFESGPHGAVVGHWAGLEACRLKPQAQTALMFMRVEGPHLFED